MKKSQQVAAVFLFASLIACASCGDVSQPLEPALTSDTDTLTEETEGPAAEEYQFPALDCQQDSFTIMNTTTTWGFHTDIYFEESTGDILNDTIYETNLKIEDTFHVKLNIENLDIGEVRKTKSPLITSIMAGEDHYQLAMISSDCISPLLLGNMLQDLTQYPELHLDEPWWDPSVYQISQLGSSDYIFFSASDVNLMNFECAMCLYVNENMLEKLGFDPLYETVRNGSWTLDKMRTYTKAAANLNGDESFQYNTEGNATYGVTVWSAAVTAMLCGGGIEFVTLDQNGIPVLNLENERFYTFSEKLKDLFISPGESIFINNNNRSHYEIAFKEGRSLFTCAQLKASSKYRDMEDTFGIIPCPKFDETQEEYYVNRTVNTLLTVIPVTVTDGKRSAIISDAMAYLANKEVLPVFYEVNLEQKQLRNEESIEMLRLIHQARIFDFGAAYGWIRDFEMAIETQMMAGNANMASLSASNHDKIQKKIDKMMEVLEKNS